MKKPYLTCECGNTSNHIGAKCWKNGQCRKCYYTPKKGIPLYKTCPNCKQVMVRLWYTKRWVSVNTKNYICTNCSEIFILNDKYRITYGC